MDRGRSVAAFMEVLEKYILIFGTSRGLRTGISDMPCNSGYQGHACPAVKGFRQARCQRKLFISAVDPGLTDKL